MNASASITAERWRFSASDFELLHEAGALDAVRKAELIDGDIYGMSPQLARHSRAKTQLALAIGAGLAAIGSSLDVMIEVSVVIANDSVPEPDIVVSSYAGDRYVPAATVSLIVEVSDSTLDRDLGRKLELYARAGIPEYWVVDLNGGRVLMHSLPDAGDYLERIEVPPGEALVSATIAGLSLGEVRVVG